MKVSIRLAQHLKGHLDRRGLIAEIEKATGIERHTVTGLLNNTVKYVSIDALAKISGYLIEAYGADASTLPGALIGRDPEHLWKMLASCDTLHCCMGARKAKEWQWAEYVMATDSRLQGVLLSSIARFEDIWEEKKEEKEKQEKEEKSEGKKKDGDDDGGGRVKKSPPLRPVPRFHLVPAPARNTTAENPGPEWPAVRTYAERLYNRLNGGPPTGRPATEVRDKENQKKESQKQDRSALIALGSIKANPVVELILANTFGAEPFASEDHVSEPADRHCPFLCRYRDEESEHKDPQPASFFGGLRLAENTEADQPGLYGEMENGQWECCPWHIDSSDAAFVFYAYWPNTAHGQVACGGFSSRATHCLTQALEQIVPKLGQPQFVSEKIHVGLYLVRFTFEPSDTEYDPFKEDWPFKHEVIPVSSQAIKRRLQHWL